MIILIPRGEAPYRCQKCPFLDSSAECRALGSIVNWEGFERDIHCPIRAKENYEKIVRCRDCKHWGGAIYGFRCKYYSGPSHTIFTNPDDFCSRAEKRSGDEEDDKTW